MVLTERAGQRDVVVMDGDGSQLNPLAITDSELSSVSESEPETESPAKSQVSPCLSSDDNDERAESAGFGEPRRERRRTAKAAERSQARRQARRRAGGKAAEKKAMREARELAEQVSQLIYDSDSVPVL